MSSDFNDAAQPATVPADALNPQYVAHIAASYFAHNQVSIDGIPIVIKAIAAALGDIGKPQAPRLGVARENSPAVPIKKSVGDDFLICLEDGKKLTMLKRYLRSQYNMSPEEYRAKWGLPADYPMVAPAYARLRSDFAKKIGLGKIATPRR